ncbi:MAG: transcriptional regulator NanR [Pseudomonadota bacterium]|nr:transcriptional regulator NanR [Pseudomonadota bacterium]
MNHEEPIPRRKLYQEVLDRLLSRIRSGEIPPGETLPSERELMEFYGVGRPAVREALQALERSGIVTISHGERARVVVPTAGDLVNQIASGVQHLLHVAPGSLEHLKEVRILLESNMARLAASRADAAGLRALRESLDEHHRLEAHPVNFMDGDIGFHTRIAALSGNPVFPVIVEATLRWLAEYYQSLVRAPGAESLTLDEHERIYAAIAARDPDAAEAAMREHLMRANELYRRLAAAPAPKSGVNP